jgi:hypothetical protein
MPQPSALMIVRISSWPEHLHEVGLLDVQQLAAQREDRLHVAVAALLGRAAGRVALDEEDLGVLVALAAAVGELAGQARALQAVLAAGQLARLARGLAGLGGHDPLLEDHLGFLGVLLQERAEPLVHRGADEALDLDVEQLVLRLALEAGLGDLDGDHRDEPLAQVVAARADVLQQADALGVLQDVLVSPS